MRAVLRHGSASRPHIAAARDDAGGLCRASVSIFLRLSRKTSPLQDNTYRHPRAGWPGRLLAALANCTRFAAVRQAILSRLPFLQLHSDVRDVVYVSWLVDAQAAQQLLPAGTPALWQRDGKTPFTVLTYRHGHFGPALLGPLRGLLPSPLQSNWRLYLDHTPPGAPDVPCVYFLKNIMDRLPHALGTRLFSDILPTHLADAMTLDVSATQARCSIAPGAAARPRWGVWRGPREASGQYSTRGWGRASAAWPTRPRFRCPAVPGPRTRSSARCSAPVRPCRPWAATPA